MKSITLMNWTRDELSQIINEVIEKQLSKLEKQLVTETELLNQDQAADFLSVSKTTFIDFKKKGLITYRKLGKRY